MKCSTMAEFMALMEKENAATVDLSQNDFDWIWRQVEPGSRNLILAAGYQTVFHDGILFRYPKKQREDRIADFSDRELCE